MHLSNFKPMRQAVREDKVSRLNALIASAPSCSRSQGLLAVGYLRSYAGMGNATLRVSRVEEDTSAGEETARARRASSSSPSSKYGDEQDGAAVTPQQHQDGESELIAVVAESHAAVVPLLPSADMADADTEDAPVGGGFLSHYEARELRESREDITEVILEGHWENKVSIFRPLFFPSPLVPNTLYHVELAKMPIPAGDVGTGMEEGSQKKTRSEPDEPTSAPNEHAVRASDNSDDPSTGKFKLLMIATY